MKITTKTVEMKNGSLVIPVAREDLWQLNDVFKYIREGKTMAVEIAPERKKRSNNANAFLWVIITDIAAAMRITKDEVYRSLIINYSKCMSPMVMPIEAAEKFKKEWNGPVQEVARWEKDGKTYVQLNVYFGSSTYNTEEFSILLDGAISDAKDIGLYYDTTGEERKRLLAEWGR